ncbi:uncharacterized protein LOC129608213 [Condylostylus longicornis]|uniref:uncharacterized protein LOC129608213 n=1 Tax=Condylostylus longicornis TaxID=2530218 RepID=UPI00244E3C3F|nr:uncharacterized protein LOC129608213 [Condylostylus longicornis]
MDSQTSSQPTSPVPQATTQQPLLQQPLSVTSNALTPATTAVVTSTSPNVVAIPVPVVPPPDDIYTYICVKGSLHDVNSSIFGLNGEEMSAMSKRFSKGTTEIVNGIMVRGPPIEVINTLSKLGYKVVCSTGEVEIVWTMQREA